MLESTRKLVGAGFPSSDVAINGSYLRSLGFVIDESILLSSSDRSDTWANMQINRTGAGNQTNILISNNSADTTRTYTVSLNNYGHSYMVIPRFADIGVLINGVEFGSTFVFPVVFTLPPQSKLIVSFIALNSDCKYVNFI